MIQIHFKNLEKSELAKEAVFERFESFMDKFSDLKTHRLHITLEMENSPLKAGPDLFTVRLHIMGRRYDNIRLEKSASNLYVALADLTDHLLEKLNRFGDRSRVKERSRARKLTVGA